MKKIILIFFILIIVIVVFSGLGTVITSGMLFDVIHVQTQNKHNPLILNDPLGKEWYKTFGENNNDWSTIEVVSTKSTGSSWHPSLMVDSDGTVHVAWDDNMNYDGSGHDSDIFYKYKISRSPENHAPNQPTRPSGETSGKAGEEYKYTTTTSDPDGNQLWFQWKWGDGDQSEWLGPYNTGDTCEAYHSWDRRGNYNIRVRAKDIHCVESDWSDPLPFSMPKNKIINPFERFIEGFPLLEFLLDFKLFYW